MAIVRTPQQIYINREIDFIIEEKIKEETPKLLFVHGNGGVGKSTLLKKFLSYDAKEIPTVLINMQENSSQSFVDMLLDEEITTIKHCPNFENLRKLLLKEPKLLKAIGSLDSDSIEKGVDEYIDEEYGEKIKVVLDIVKIGAKWKEKDLEKKKKEFLNNPEYVLLSALAEDFKEYGLFMVDTFEKIKNSNIKSKITFLDSGEIAMSLKEKNYRLKDYVEGLVYLLVENSTFIIAGRNSQDELNMEVPADYTDELALDNFSVPNITELFRIYSKRDSKLYMPTAERIEQIHNLTNGNPLLVGLFPKVAKEYESWDELDYEEMERRIKTDDEFGLLFYMTDRVLTHLDESTEVWRLVIPRVLNIEVERLLFRDEKILKELIEVGLATKGIGKDSERYYLHDDVHRAIVAYYEREFKGEFSSWHDAEVVAGLHRELMEFYEKHGELHGVNSDFEGCYHKMMLREGFEKEFELSREEFASSILGHVSWSYDKKFQYCQKFNELSHDEIIDKIEKIEIDKEFYLSLMSQELYTEISNNLAKGSSNQGRYDIDFFLKLLKKKKFEGDSTVYFYLGFAYSSKREYNKAIKAYQKSLKINPKKAETYNNIGGTYVNNQENDKGIKALEKAIALNPKYAEAYGNLGNAYINLQQFEKAIEFTQKAIELNPKRDMAYANLGNIYIQLQQFEKVIEFSQKAIELNPKNDGAYLNLGNAYINLQQFEKGIEFTQKAIELNPKNDGVYNSMGIAYYWLGQFDEAIKSYIKAININSNESEAYVNLFELQLTQNQPFDQELEKKYIELFQNQKETFIAYEMLKILQDMVQNQEVNLEDWVQKYRGVGLGSWSFNELNQWIDELEDEVLKMKLREAVEIFERHG